MITFDPDALSARRAELEQQMGEPGFWDDQDRAARISTEHARVTRKLDRYERLLRDYDDARELLFKFSQAVIQRFEVKGNHGPSRAGS